MIDEAAVQRLEHAVQTGGVVLIPTDTVYGLAAGLDVPAGVEALYTLKGRPRDQPCQVLLYSRALLDEAIALSDDRVAPVLQALLPGPVTCIVTDPSGRYVAATGGQPGSVGIRAPRMDGPLAVFTHPLIATSANDPGGPDPRTLSDVPSSIRHGVACELDAGTLPGTASAVLDLRPLAVGQSALLVRRGPADLDLVRRLDTLGVRVQTPSVG